METLKSIESCQALESLIMNSGVAMKYGNDSSADLSEVSVFFSVLVLYASWILFSEYSLLFWQSALEAMQLSLIDQCALF